MIADARLRLRQEMLKRYPHLIDESIAMVKRRLPMPIELAGLTSRMARAESQEKQIAELGKRYDDVQSDIDDAIDAHKDHVDNLEHFRDAWMRKVDSMLARPNGGDPLEGDARTGQPGQSGKDQSDPPPGTTNAKKVTITTTDVGTVEAVLPQVSPVASDPERLTVNGVQTSS
jgi:hypothetical protein